MSVCDIPVISSVCDVVGEGAATLVAAPFDWLAQAMGAAAGWLFEAVWSVFDTTTLVDVTRPGYVSVYNLLFGVAVFVMLIFFCLQLITGLIRRDPTALTRAALGLAKSVLGSFVVITLTALLLEVVDQLCIGIVQAAGETTESMGDKIALLATGLVGINIAAPGVGAIITIFMAGLAITAAAIVWLSLLVRKALLLVAIVFAPLAFSGASWDASRGWIGKWAMFVVALICSKLVLVVMFLVAITQVSAPIDADLASISDPIAGIVLMAMAAFAPYLTYKFIAFVGFDMYHAIGSEQDAKHALNRPIPVPGRGAGGGAEPSRRKYSTAQATPAVPVVALAAAVEAARRPRRSPHLHPRPEAALARQVEVRPLPVGVQRLPDPLLPSWSGHRSPREPRPPGRRPGPRSVPRASVPRMPPPRHHRHRLPLRPQVRLHSLRRLRRVRHRQCRGAIPHRRHRHRNPHRLRRERRRSSRSCPRTRTSAARAISCR